MKVNLSSHDHEVAFQERGLSFSKHPYLQRSVKMATRRNPLKVEANSTRSSRLDLVQPSLKKALDS